MNCVESQRSILEGGGRDLPAACLDHLVGCAECRKVNERTVMVTRLLALKRHEHPDPLFEIRNAAAIRKRLGEEKPSLWESLLGLGLRPWHGLAAAAACLAAAGAVYFGAAAPRGPAAPALADQRDVPAAVRPDPNDPAWNTPIFVTVSNPSLPLASGGHTEFGISNGATRPAAFEVETPRRAQE